MRNLTLKKLKVLIFSKNSSRLVRFLLKGIFILFFLTEAQASPLIVGALSPSPNTEIKKLYPLANYLASQLQAYGFVKEGRVRIEKNISQMSKLLRSKKVDLYLGTPFNSIALEQSAEMSFLVQAVSQGAGKHSSVIFVRTDSPVKYLRDLKGEVIAFENSLSTFGYLLPKSLLKERGYKLKFLKKVTDPAPSEEVAYVFSQDDGNTLLWVKKRKVGAGAVDAEAYQKQAEESLAQLRIIERTISLPPLLIGYRSTLSPELVKALKEILKKMHKTDEGKAILSGLEDISRFQDIIQRDLNVMSKKFRVEFE